MTKKIVTLLSAIVAAIGMLIVMPSMAQAQAKVVYPGMKITFVDPANAAQFCTLGVVGTDAAGRSLALSAGHCVNTTPENRNRAIDPSEPIASQLTVYDVADSQLIGHIRYMSDTGGTGAAFSADVMVIELAPGTVPDSDGPGFRLDATAPDGLPIVSNSSAPGSIINKYGARTQAIMRGNTTGRDANGLVRTWARHDAGDSGGPVWLEGTTQWAGLTRGTCVCWGPFTHTSHEAIRTELASTPFAGFQPVNN